MLYIFSRNSVYGFSICQASPSRFKKLCSVFQLQIVTPVAWRPPFPLSFLQGHQGRRSPRSASDSERDRFPPAAPAETTTAAEGGESLIL